MITIGQKGTTLPIISDWKTSFKTLLTKVMSWLKPQEYNHVVFKDSLDDHGNGGTPNEGNNNSDNYASVGYEYIVNKVNQVDDHVSTITIKNKNLEGSDVTYSSLLGSPLVSATS